MKFLVVLVIVACAIGFSEAGPFSLALGVPTVRNILGFLQCGLTPEQLELFKATIKGCASKEGASDADVQAIFNYKLPSSHGGKCTVACVGETGGMIEGNKLDLEGSVALAMKNDPSKGDLAREIGSACVDITDGDRCEAAFKVFHCLYETAVAKGIKIAH